MRDEIGIGLVGAGWIGRVHAEQYRRVGELSIFPNISVALRGISDIDEELVRTAVKDFGFERGYTDWREMVADPRVDVIDICTPNSLHHEIAIAAATQGKHILCEKPLSISAQESKEMWVTAKRAGIHHMVNFNYRRAPAVALAKLLLEAGEIGHVYAFRAGFTQDFAADPKLPWSWRFDTARAGGGSLVTMGSHAIDLARYLVGDVKAIVATSKTHITERSTMAGEVRPVDVDDCTHILLRFAGGAEGVLYTSWLAHGRKHHFEWELHGSKGSLFFNSERLNELQIYESTGPDERRGFKTVYLGEKHPYGEILGLKAGMGIGIRETFLLQIVEFLSGIATGNVIEPSFYDGWQVDRTVESVSASQRSGDWIEL